MAGDVVKAEHVNPFIISVCKIMKDMCMLDLKIGKPGIKKGGYLADSSLIKLGLHFIGLSLNMIFHIS